MSLINSIYFSTFNDYYNDLPDVQNMNKYIFTSFHIEEEMKILKKEDIYKMCKLLNEKGYRIIADVSGKNLEIYGENFFEELSQAADVYMLRCDYGFTTEDKLKLANNFKICINASDAKEDEILTFKSNGLKVEAMYNYYPRTETGIDEELFYKVQSALNRHNISPSAFIASDVVKRGPIFDGLCTIESHRYLKPYVAYLLLSIRHKVANILVGDGILSKKQSELIEFYENDEIIRLPLIDCGTGFDLYNKVFTIRGDSPKNLLRIAESRVFSRKGTDVPPSNTVERLRGSITVDNVNYSRYTGEIMLVREDKKEDERVNVVAKIADEYIKLLDIIDRNSKIMFIRWNKNV